MEHRKLTVVVAVAACVVIVVAWDCVGFCGVQRAPVRFSVTVELRLRSLPGRGKQAALLRFSSKDSTNTLRLHWCVLLPWCTVNHAFGVAVDNAMPMRVPSLSVRCSA